MRQGDLRRVSGMLTSVLLLASLVLTGCTGGQRPAGQAGAPAPAASGTGKTSDQQSKPIRIGLSPWPGWFVWYLVQEKGFFQKHGVNVELVWFPVYSDSLQALAAGKIDGNSQTLSDTLAPAAKGVPLKAVLINDNSSGGDGLIVKPGIKSVQELRGKKVATELGTVDHLLLLTALDRVGMKESDVNFTNMTVNDAGPAFIAGQLDAAVLWEPFLTQATKQGKGEVIFSSKDTPGLIPDLLVLSEKVTKERPDDVVKILAAWFDALQYWKEHPDESLAIMAKKAETPLEDYKVLVGGIKVFSLDDNLKAFVPGDSLESLHASARRTAEFLKGKGMLEQVPDPAKMLDDSFLKRLKRPRE